MLDMAVLCCAFGEVDRDAAHFGDGLLYRGQRRVAASTERQAVESHHGDVIRNGQSPRTERADEPEGHHVVRRDHCGRSLSMLMSSSGGTFAGLQPDAGCRARLEPFGAVQPALGRPVADPRRYVFPRCRRRRRSTCARSSTRWSNANWMPFALSTVTVGTWWLDSTRSMTTRRLSESKGFKLGRIHDREGRDQRERGIHRLHGAGDIRPLPQRHSP